MNYQLLGKSTMNVSRISLGLFRLGDKNEEEAVNILRSALDNGINFFDHADIYGGNGKSELIFSNAMGKIGVNREDYYLQSKVGIRPGLEYSFEKDYIISSVEGILQRLNTTYLDSLLLHRPDMLWEPKEVAKAFKVLKESGKVKFFGVSNMNENQIKLLQRELDFPLITNQLQFSIMHADLVSSGIYNNTRLRPELLASSSIFDFLRLEDITMQAWSPLQHGFFEGVFIDNDDFPELNNVLEIIASKHNSTKTAISLAWILKLPFKIQVIIGTMTPSRIIDSCKATEVELTREEWYEIFMASNNELI